MCTRTLDARLGADVKLRRYRSCDLGADVDLYTIIGGGHTWPGSAITLGKPGLTTSTIDATRTRPGLVRGAPPPSLNGRADGFPVAGHDQAPRVTIGAHGTRLLRHATQR